MPMAAAAAASAGVHGRWRESFHGSVMTIDVKYSGTTTGSYNKKEGRVFGTTDPDNITMKGTYYENGVTAQCELTFSDGGGEFEGV